MPRLSLRLAPVLAGALLLAACQDEPTAPLSPATLSPRLAAGGNGNGNGPSSLDLIEDDYAIGLLDKDNANRYREYAVSASAVGTFSVFTLFDYLFSFSFVQFIMSHFPPTSLFKFN